MVNVLKRPIGIGRDRCTLRFSGCMRSHGIPTFPDPKFIKGADGREEVELPGINPQAPAFQAAAKTCAGGPEGR